MEGTSSCNRERSKPAGTATLFLVLNNQKHLRLVKLYLSDELGYSANIISEQYSVIDWN